MNTSAAQESGSSSYTISNVNISNTVSEASASVINIGPSLEGLAPRLNSGRSGDTGGNQSATVAPQDEHNSTSVENRDVNHPAFTSINGSSDEICSMMPTLPEVPEFFTRALASVQFFLEGGLARDLMPPQDTMTSNEMHMWMYILKAVCHFQPLHAILTQRGMTHGEVWWEINVWGHIIDVVFLYSNLTLDRKEVHSNVSRNNFDGIVRTISLNARNRLDFAFVEVKPDRQPYEKCSASDRCKVLKAMQQALISLRTLTNEEAMKDIISVGIICNGMNMTILKACHPQKDLFLLQEHTMELGDISMLPEFLTVCWRLKLALEATYDTVRKAMQMPPPNL